MSENVTCIVINGMSAVAFARLQITLMRNRDQYKNPLRGVSG